MGSKQGKRNILLLLVIVVGVVAGIFRQSQMHRAERNAAEESWESLASMEKSGKQEELSGKWGKGYDLPVEEEERAEAEAGCKAAMELIEEIYRQADKGSGSNVVISDRTILEMKEKIRTMGTPVTSSKPYAVMENYEEMENFLINAENGEAGELILFWIRGDGGVRRLKFICDGKDLYVLESSVTWNKEGNLTPVSVSYTRIKEWSYTEKGYFCYELCVPEPPEVTEIVDGSCLVRVKPLNQECRKLSEAWVLPLGYQGNNLLCSNWDMENMEGIDYNGVYECFYEMKYGEVLDREKYLLGVPEEEFQHIIMEYLPVSSEQIREWAVFDQENQTYPLAMEGCGNYAPTYFGTSVPEITDVRRNGDGTVTLTVDAVCQMMLCDDAVITHELTVRILEDGGFQYLGNRILDNGVERIPGYQYRIDED